MAFGSFIVPGISLPPTPPIILLSYPLTALFPLFNYRFEIRKSGSKAALFGMENINISRLPVSSFEQGFQEDTINEVS